MTDNVAAWVEELKKTKTESKSLKAFAKARGIRFITLQTHVPSNHSKRFKAGSVVGRPSAIGSAEEAIIVNVLVRKDRANEGAGVGWAVDILK
jgi:hypothetical protein